jgi:hypothetical protein
MVEWHRFLGARPAEAAPHSGLALLVELVALPGALLQGQGPGPFPRAQTWEDSGSTSGFELGADLMNVASRVTPKRQLEALRFVSALHIDDQGQGVLDSG